MFETNYQGIQSVLNYIYTNEISVDIQTIEAIIVCVQELSLKKLTQMCELCLVKLEASHLLEVLQISKKRHLGKSFYRAFRKVCNCFDRCVESNFFFKLNINILIEILANTTNCRNETLLFQKIVCWINSNKHASAEHISKLMSQIQFNNINIFEFQYMLKENNFIMQIPECGHFYRQPK